MTRYIAFLRAINVGGKGIVKMEDLRKAFAMPGLKNISTYIQTGNVIFETAETDEAKLRQKIEKNLEKKLGFEIPSILRTFEELEAVVKNNPFKKIKESKETPLYISLLPAEPSKEQVKLITALNTERLDHRVVAREIYCLCQRNEKGTTDFSNSIIEKKLKMPATARNLSTITKILAL
jgi:uncharacterized protein (DUF1697 family)